MIRTVEDVDWANWVPRERATLLFAIRDERVLLILKKRGFGKGKINAPGGKIEPGETPMECAVRETREEVLIDPKGVRPAGELRFAFSDGHSIHGFVFVASAFEGEPGETEEAVPLWFALEEIPFDRMWEDDATWIPEMLAGRPFSGRYVFSGDRMLDWVLTDDHAAFSDAWRAERLGPIPGA